jgi:putative endonuclease
MRRWQNFDPRHWITQRSGSTNKADIDGIAADDDVGDNPSAPSALQADTLAPHLALGRLGEQLAAAYLEQHGFRLVASNFKLPVGRNLRGAIIQTEIDIVAYEGTTLCFIEVKTRRSDWYAAPEANVDLRKQRQITRAARAYRRTFGLERAPHRYDVVSVIIPPVERETITEETQPTSSPQITLFRNFWTNEKFSKRRWHETAFHH